MVQIGESELELVEEFFVSGEGFDEGDDENGTSDVFGIGLIANGASGFVDWLGRGRKEGIDFVKKRQSEAEASHKENATFGFGDETR